MKQLFGSKIQQTKKIKVNDYIELSKNGITKKYKVVGFIQSINYGGEIFEMTIDGYKQLDEQYTPLSIYVYLNDETKVFN